MMLAITIALAVKKPIVLPGAGGLIEATKRKTIGEIDFCEIRSPAR